MEKVPARPFDTTRCGVRVHVWAEVSLAPACAACLQGFDELDAACSSSPIAATTPCSTQACSDAADMLNHLDAQRLDNVDGIDELRPAYSGASSACQRVSVIHSYCGRRVSAKSPLPHCFGAEASHICHQSQRCPALDGRH
eukprot:gnl/Hemi2/12189_TR4167_c0_g1_i1.p1 gnl/Hemi2/12189_TR4167_c0_g1~~gnl/Hemi2/12189_TR4167_c0_g1_i1.p1  ORF type:complete len:141 (-),score=42.32 gnl/Hemi2/12189_TR4167_c0_g1_i1:61-483(-)